MTEFEHTELKTCPFCGGEAHVEEHKFWNDITRSFDIKTYSVVCDECSSTSFQHYRIKQAAIEAWNTRKPTDRIVEQLEKWKQEADEQYEDTDSELYKMASVGKYHAYKQAIEIVKEGGKDE